MTRHRRLENTAALRMVLGAFGGCAIASFVVGICATLILAPDIITTVPDPNMDSDWIPATPMQMALNLATYGGYAVLAGLMWGLPAFAILGLPIHAALMHGSKTGLLPYAGFGVIAAGLILPIAMLLIEIAFGSQPPSKTVVRNTLEIAGWCALAGALASSIFWLIRRPDRDEPPAHMPQPPAA